MTTAPGKRVIFLYNAQLHQMPHSLPIAIELARHYPHFDVQVAAPSPVHLNFARRLTRQYAAAPGLHFGLLRQPWPVALYAKLSGALAPVKVLTLFGNLRYLRSADAIVTPERTSLLLRQMGLGRRTRLIYTGHGAGDRAKAVAPEIRNFDYVLVHGRKLERRRSELGLIRPGHYVSGIYAKFDWLQRSGQIVRKLFPNDRPTVLYCPHFDPRLSSWHRVGRQVLDFFAASERYNLIFAPHVRLFEPPRRWKYRPFRRYEQLPHMRIDLGSEHSVDMTYTLAADLYLGDVSSQIAEFMIRPRPCVFLNPRATPWQGDENYRFWTLGPVVEDLSQLDAALQDALGSGAQYLDAQRRYFDETFDGVTGASGSALKGARAIAEFLSA